MTDLEEFQVPGHAGALHVRLWTPNSTPRALIFILHGYAEHGGRYSHVAEALVAQGLGSLPQTMSAMDCLKGNVHSLQISA